MEDVQDIRPSDVLFAFRACLHTFCSSFFDEEIALEECQIDTCVSSPFYFKYDILGF